MTHKTENKTPFLFVLGPLDGKYIQLEPGQENNYQVLGFQCSRGQVEGCKKKETIYKKMVFKVIDGGGYIEVMAPRTATSHGVAAALHAGYNPR